MISFCNHKTLFQKYLDIVMLYLEPQIYWQQIVTLNIAFSPGRFPKNTGSSQVRVEEPLVEVNVVIC